VIRLHTETAGLASMPGQGATARGDLMKAIVQERFGPPDVLQLVDTGPPAAGAGEVLVRVHAAALNPYDWHVLRGDPLIARLMGEVGLTKPKARVAGIRERLRLIPHEQEREQLLTLTGLIEAGKLTPVLDRTYPLAGTAEGLRRVEQGHACGKVVITVA
jgi:NADPH:quinone reductase-like Zn-dependent oxidoreductase